MFPPIGWLVSKGYVSPAFGRMLEVAGLTALSAGIAFASDAISGGNLIDLKGMLTVVVTAFLAYVSKAVRDAAAPSVTVVYSTPPAEGSVPEKDANQTR